MTKTILVHDRPAMKINIVAEPHAEYDAIPDYDYEHHCVEHEHEGKQHFMENNLRVLAFER